MLALSDGMCYTLHSETGIFTFSENKMKLSKVDIDRMAKALSDRLLCSAGLKDAKKIVAQMRRNLLAEDKRRKKL